MKGWKKVFHTNRDQNKAGLAILISDKIDFEIKAVKRDKEEHYIMTKGSIQEDITIINIYAPNIYNTAAFQAPLSMGFARQEYWSGVPLPSLCLCHKSPENKEK